MPMILPLITILHETAMLVWLGGIFMLTWIMLPLMKGSTTGAMDTSERELASRTLFRFFGAVQRRTTLCIYFAMPILVGTGIALFLSWGRTSSMKGMLFAAECLCGIFMALVVLYRAVRGPRMTPAETKAAIMANSILGILLLLLNAGANSL